MKNFIAFVCALTIVIPGFMSLDKAIAQNPASAEAKDYLPDPLDTPFYDPSATECGTQSNPQTSTSSTGRVFYIGDSLMYGMTKIGDLLSKTNVGGFTVDTKYIDTPSPSSPRVSGSSVEATGGIRIDETMSNLDTHPQDIAAGKVDTVVIGLGTNIDTDMPTKINSLISKIKTLNSSVKILWITTYFPASKSKTFESVNQDIKNSAAGNYDVIDIASAISADPSLAPDGGDGIHYGPEGYKKRSDFIVKNIPKNSAVSSTSIGTYDPLSLTYPSFPDEASIANGIDSVIKKRSPSSGWLASPGFGARLMEKSKAANINPLFIVASGNIESNFGLSPVALAHNNSFGMKSSESTYRDFATMEEGVFAFVNIIPRNLSGDGASGAYKNVKNIYEYFSVHQSGGIHYPGDGMNVYDAAMDVYISWDPNANSSKPGNPQYTPMIYYRTNVGLINEVTGLHISDTAPGLSTAVASTCSATGKTGSTAKGSGLISPLGYVLPIEPQTKKISGIGAGWSGLTRPDGQPVHHDRTAAFDLFGPGTQGNAGGDRILALHDGVIEGVGTQDPDWCYSIQFKSSDGYFYWYGHMNHVVVHPGDKVAVNDYLGETAQWTPEHTCAGSSGATHLHIDRGCVIDGKPQGAGYATCRDPDFIEMLSKLYETLPN